jgi:LAO/AO transport system kinase
MLARTITLIESNAAKDAMLAEEVVQALLPHSGGSIRVGITGVPGVGKSTFIETIGIQLCRAGLRVAVLAVDPSSSISKGSILGDKTRMETLSQEPRAFIRPSPSGGTLGGVTRKTRESILACEAFGFDVVLVETVGVGQSETAVRSMVDFFLVLLLAGAGDELQGIKKGIIELADLLVITKADGDNKQRAEADRAEFARVMHYLSPPNAAWHPQVLTCSSLNGEGIREVWDVVGEFRRQTTTSGMFEQRRRTQVLDWSRDLLQQELWRAFSSNPDVVKTWPDIEQRLLAGKISPSAAVRTLLIAGNRKNGRSPVD